MWEVFEAGWVFIGSGKIASRLGFTVTRFECNGYIFLKIPPKSCHDFCGVTQFWWKKQIWKLWRKSCHDFCWRDAILKGQSLECLTSKLCHDFSTVSRFWRQNENFLIFFCWTSPFCCNQKIWRDSWVTTSLLCHNYLGRACTWHFQKFSCLLKWKSCFFDDIDDNKIKERRNNIPENKNGGLPPT